MPDDTPEQPTQTVVTLPTGGSIPGIPGHHGPGTYLVNWLERTITPIVVNVEEWVERMIEKSQITPVENAPTEAPANTSEQAN